MLMPAAVLILLLLASLAVDTALVWTAERELANRAAAAANDVAATALDDERYYASGVVALDQREAEAAVAAQLIGRGDGALTDIGLEMLAVDERTVTVTLTGSVRTLFTPALPGDRRARTVRATAVVHAAAG